MLCYQHTLTLHEQGVVLYNPSPIGCDRTAKFYWISGNCLMTGDEAVYSAGSKVGMSGTQNFTHGIYREKIPRYRVYRGTCLW